MRGLSNRKGFTFVEMMVALGIFSILIAAIYTVLLIGDSTTRTGLTFIEVSQDARLGVEYMLKELRHAQRSTISIPEDGSSITFKVPGNANTIQYTLGGLNGRQLIRTEVEAGTSTVLCNNLKGIQFSLTGRIISITLKAGKTSLFSRPRVDLSTNLNVRVKVRN